MQDFSILAETDRHIGMDYKQGNKSICFSSLVKLPTITIMKHSPQFLFLVVIRSQGMPKSKKAVTIIKD